jgi:hypothetical protein
MSELLKRAITQKVDKVLKDDLPRLLDGQLPAIVEASLQKLFEKGPDRELTTIGFHWAFALALRRYWPDVSNVEAARWLEDYLPDSIGSEGYQWTPAAASALATDYVNEFGEHGSGGDHG